MNKKIIAIPVAVVAIAVIAGNLFEGERDVAVNEVFHVTLASPDLYENGVYSEKIVLDGGEYSFRFVPNGDSPRVLSVSIRGDVFDFSEDFELVGTLHQTGISEYYTWDYNGQKTITVASRELVLVEINPNGDVLGPVSVDILRN